MSKPAEKQIHLPYGLPSRRKRSRSGNAGDGATAKLRRPQRGSALNPLPSFLRASALDATNRQMRGAGRTCWNADDWDKAADELDQLIRSCYGNESDHDEPDRCFLRFQIAERMEREGLLGAFSGWSEVGAAIDNLMQDASVVARAAR